MTITVNRLHKILNQMVEDGHGRKPVVLENPNDELTHPLDDVRLEFVGEEDGDGCAVLNSDGTEKGRICLCLSP